MLRLGAVEIGGTHCKMATGDGSGPVLDPARIVRTSTGDRAPNAVIDELVEYFAGASLDALGVGSFGPLELPEGRFTPGTPKPGWGGVALRGELVRRLGIPVVVETDVNAAVLGEATWGAAQDVESALYVTVGTGIGAGALVHGSLVSGLSHPEMGHMRIPQPPEGKWRGVCPYHDGCWEGLASGSALSARYGCPPEELEDEAAWALEADQLALGVANLVAVYRPERIVLGGGVLEREGLLERVRIRAAVLLDPRYFPEAARLEDLLRPPALGDTAGLQGAFLLARDAAAR